MSFQIVAAVLPISSFKYNYVVARSSCIGNPEVFCEMLGDKIEKNEMGGACGTY